MRNQMLGFLLLASIAGTGMYAQTIQYGSKNECISIGTANRMKTNLRIKAKGCWWDVNGNGIYDNGEEIDGDGNIEGKWLTADKEIHIYAESFESFDTIANTS